MTFKTLLPILLCALVTSCAATRPKDASDYTNSLAAPQRTEDFIQTEKKVFDEPILGVMLRYENMTFPEDMITIYVYPIADYDWEDIDTTLESEIKQALKEVDVLVQYGHYQSREKENWSDLTFTDNEREYKGKKVNFVMTDKQGNSLYSDIYMFIAQDKYIKFRTSFDSRMAKGSDGDKVVKELLPKITVPPESIYMKNLRAEHKQRVQESLMKAIMQALKESKSENNNNAN